MKNIIKVDGMKCSHCASNVKNTLEGLKGISEVEVNLDSKEVSYNSDNLSSMEEIKKAISEKGFKVIEC